MKIPRITNYEKINKI